VSGGDGRERTNRAVVVLFAAATVLLAAVALPLWRPLVLAAVLAGPLGGWHDRLARALGRRRTISAALFTVAVVVLLLLPIAAASFFIVEQAIQLAELVRKTLEQKGVSGVLHPLPDQIEHWLQGQYQELVARPRAVVAKLGVWSRTGWALSTLAAVLGTVSHFLFSLLMMLIALFFLLRDGHALAAWLRRESPIPQKYADAVLDELAAVSKSVIGGNVLTGAAQSVVATAGYLIAGVPSALFFGLLTFIAAFVPALGTAAAGVPAILLLVAIGRGWWALFLGVWMLLVVGLVDNLLRPILMRSGSNLHGSLIFFSLMGGILAFGAMGLVVGPLALAFFLAMNAALRRARA
jgi:predicted PurR-regulated permease PerM